MNHSDMTDVTSRREGRQATTDSPPEHLVDHPDWCDLARCTATSAVAVDEAHRGTPQKVTFRGIYSQLEITASLSQAHCRWSTDVYVDLDVRGLLHEHQHAQGRAAFPVDKLAAIARMLTDLATAGQAWTDRQVDKELAAVRRGISAEWSASAGPGVRYHGEEVDR
jgi:hypothetical protein